MPRPAALPRLTAVALGALLTATLSPGAVHADSADAPADEAGRLVPLRETGDPDDRLNLVILGDGYTAQEMPRFREEAELHLNVQWSIEPFRSYRDYFNVYLLETPSEESGVRCDPRTEDPDVVTPLRLHYADGCSDPETARGITYGPAPEGDPRGADCPEVLGDRRCTGDQQRAMYLENALSDLLGADVDGLNNIQTLAMANTTTYGGIGGRHATTSGGSPQGPLISPHELGHSLGNLQDEYPYSNRGVPGGPYQGAEPASVHHTLHTTEEMLDQEAKWWRWLGEESESGGVIDRFESGMTSSEGVWRPSRNSMMRWLGYYFDQVGRERMTERISGMRDAETLAVRATPEGPIGAGDALWVEPPNPRYHELDVTWSVDGTEVEDTNGARSLELADLDLESGQTVSVTVQDPTEFVRDPEIREAPMMTQSREWTVGDPLDADPVEVAFTNSTDTESPVGGDDVIFAETTHPTDRVFDVTWEVDGEAVSGGHDRTLHLSDLDLAEGTYTVTARASDPDAPDGDSDELTWTVDNVGPTALVELSEPLTTVDGDVTHQVYFEEFTMGLDPQDDQPGHVVGEFQLRGEGWHNYYGWPDAPAGTPFLFTPTGTTIREIDYGALSPEGMVLAPFEEREPGYGTHTVEHRAIDAAGNIGEAEEFRATVLPGASPECTETITGGHDGGLTLTSGVTCLEDAEVSGGVTLESGASLVARDSQINGGLTASDADSVQLLGTGVRGATEIAGSTGAVVLVASALDGSVAVRENQVGEHPLALAGNRLHGSIDCADNDPGVADYGLENEITGSAAGQCAEL
ncbi:peptidase M64 [Spiractinospora alimapuensis]|uniref:M64 family metallopeptidase n=1 Tax=Spiractinospora alimapuensis TaxID=2820884 RepID=UPI001F47E545|nr:M64 family metallopeptidase [Spiractinospora alimapuensis]QVQ52338.1 peptidase M64 [Spiractinospora alimapuensis]